MSYGFMDNISNRPRPRMIGVAGALCLSLGFAGCSAEAPTGATTPATAVGRRQPPAAGPRASAEPSTAAWPEAKPLPNVPAWAVDALFYQVFPERFRNGDPANDPTRESLETPDAVPPSWSVSPWTGDWYARAAWEQALGENFFDHGVFDRRYGGDLQGVLNKLDYLAELGVNVLYFNPVFYGRSLHKYDAASMHHIDPYFGPDPAGDFELISQETSDPQSWHWTAADKLFLKLLAEARSRGMRVIIDGVFNHTGRDFFAFKHIREHQRESPYVDWYIVQHFDDPATPQDDFRYKSWWGFESLPEFADNESGDDLHSGPKQYVMDVTRRWMDPNADGDPADGIDGWRLDVANEVPIKFWREWNATVRNINPAAYTVAEVWGDAREFLLGGGFSATMNYHAFAFPTKGFLIDGRLSAHDFGRELRIRLEEYPPAMRFALQNLVDSHDTDRLASMIVNRPRKRPYLQPDRFDYDVSERVSPRHDRSYDVRRPSAADRRIQRMVVMMQMAYLGAPMIYYGDEAGMWGGDDPCDRLPMVWEDLSYEPQAGDPLGRNREADPVEFDRELFDYYAAAVALRRDSAALRRGSLSVAVADDAAKFFGFRRQLGREHALVLFNRGDKPYRYAAPAPSEGAWELALSSSQQPGVEVADGDAGQEISVPPLTSVVLVNRSTKP